MLLKCFICGHVVAKIVDPAFPLSGAMFMSKDEFHGVPAPWSPVAEWDSMYCPMCNYRAIQIPDFNEVKLLTVDDGEIVVGVDGIKSLPVAPVDPIQAEVPTPAPAAQDGPADPIAVDAEVPTPADAEVPTPADAVAVVAGVAIAADSKPKKQAKKA